MTHLIRHWNPNIFLKTDILLVCEYLHNIFAKISDHLQILSLQLPKSFGFEMIAIGRELRLQISRKLGQISIWNRISPPQRQQSHPLLPVRNRVQLPGNQVGTNVPNYLNYNILLKPLHFTWNAKISRITLPTAVLDNFILHKICSVARLANSNAITPSQSTT